MKANSNEVRLGSASVTINFNDQDGFSVIHTQDNAVLASKPAERCDKSDWDKLWETIRAITAG